MSQLHLLTTKRFLPMFLTQFLGAFNDNLFKNALVIMVAFKASAVLGLPASQAVVLAGGVFILPFFLFSATSGQIADKYEKSKLIRLTKVVEIVVMGLAALGFIYANIELLFLVLFLMGAQSTLFGPVKYSILPQHLRENEVVGGNALVEAGTFLAILIGTIAGGVLITYESGPLYVSLSVLIIAISGFMSSLFIPHAPSQAPDIRIEWSMIKPTIDVINMTRTKYTVFLSIMAISWFWFFGAAFLSLFPVYAKDSLTADESVVTLFLATFSLGIGVGSLLCEAMSRKRLELGLVPFGSLGMSFFAADLYFAGVPHFFPIGTEIAVNYIQFIQNPGGLRILADLLGLSIFSGFFIVPLYTFIQIHTSTSERSRIIAANNVMNSLFMVIASLVLMLFIKMEMSSRQIFFVLACMNAVVATYIYLYMPEFLLRFYAWCLARVMYRLKVNHHELIPAEGPAVLVCNHVTYVDWLILAAAIKRPLRFVMDHSFYKGWLLRTLLNQAKVIPIAPAKDNAKVLDRAFERIKSELAKGEVVCIFPEGTLTSDGAMRPFRPGIERIINTSPVPVVPMALRNVWGSYFSRKGGAALKKIPRRFWSPISLEIGTQIPPEKVTAAFLQSEVQKLLDAT